MFDFVYEAGGNESLLAEGTGFAGTFKVGCQKLHLLGDVYAFLVILAVAVDVCEEPPVIKVIDCVFKEGVSCLVASKVTTDPGGEWLHWFVSGIIRRGV